MKLTIEIDEDEIAEMAKQMVAESVAKGMLSQYRSNSEKYNYRRIIKEAVREAIKSDIDNLADRAVAAASTSITNRGLKKVSTDELLARIAGRDGEG